MSKRVSPPKKRGYAAAIALLLALAATAALFVACGDDDDGGASPGTIHTENGLGVAMVAANADLARSETDQRGESSGGVVGPEAPSDDGTGGGGTDTSGDQAAVVQQVTSQGMTVSGYGTATVTADTAIAEFYFGTYGTVPVRPDDSTEPTTGSSGEGSSGSESTTTSAGGITEADLQPVIDALTGIGIDRADIEFLGSSYYYDAYWSSATLRVTVRDLDRLGDVVDAATSASANLGDITLQSTYVSYMVEDCGPLEEAALGAAVEDAEARGDAFASALGVTRGALTGAQTYSYSPFGGSPCGIGNIGPYPVAEVAYSQSSASDVTIYANVTLTYAME